MKSLGGYYAYGLQVVSVLVRWSGESLAAFTYRTRLEEQRVMNFVVDAAKGFRPALLNTSLFAGFRDPADSLARMRRMPAEDDRFANALEEFAAYRGSCTGMRAEEAAEGFHNYAKRVDALPTPGYVSLVRGNEGYHALELDKALQRRFFDSRLNRCLNICDTKTPLVKDPPTNVAGINQLTGRTFGHLLAVRSLLDGRGVTDKSLGQLWAHGVAQKMIHAVIRCEKGPDRHLFVKEKGGEMSFQRGVLGEVNL